MSFPKDTSNPHSTRRSTKRGRKKNSLGRSFPQSNSNQYSWIQSQQEVAETGRKICTKKTERGTKGAWGMIHIASLGLWIALGNIYICQWYNHALFRTIIFEPIHCVLEIRYISIFKWAGYEIKHTLLDLFVSHDGHGSITGRVRHFHLLQCVQTSCVCGGGGATQPPIQWLLTADSLGVWSSPLPLGSADFKNALSSIPTPPYVYTAWCLIKQRTALLLYIHVYMSACEGTLP
jgi:hypothetical protein